jgi:hypothetical protein
MPRAISLDDRTKPSRLAFAVPADSPVTAAFLPLGSGNLIPDAYDDEHGRSADMMSKMRRGCCSTS